MSKRCSAKPPFRFGIRKRITPRDFNLQTGNAKAEPAAEKITEPAVEEPVAEESQPAAAAPEGIVLADAGFSAASIKNLEANNIFTVEQLEAYISTGETLEALPKIGERSARKIEEELAQWKTETAVQNSIG